MKSSSEEKGELSTEHLDALLAKMLAELSGEGRLKGRERVFTGYRPAAAERGTSDFEQLAHASAGSLFPKTRSLFLLG